MSIQDINRIQDEANQAYNRVPQSEAAGWAQAIAQCEIALQLAGINEKLAKIVDDGEFADMHCILLRDIRNSLDKLR